MAFTTGDGKTRTALAEINMIPFIDVMLVLLIIFMITVPAIQSGIQVEVPVTQSTAEVTEDLLVVTIDRNEELYLQDAKVNINLLASKIQEKLPTVKSKKVYLRGDKGVTLQTLASVMDALHRAGVTDLVFVTTPYEGKP
jgi:biopolymer transport protein TolR